MKKIVITGSSRGIGYGLAREFLHRGHQVVISGRSAERLELARNRLKEETGNEAIDTVVCDVTDPAAVQKLCDTASSGGKIDIWINNAGMGQGTRPFEALDPEDIRAILDINLKGMMAGCQAALAHMQSTGSGAIYNMEGFGSDGRKMKNMTVYGTTKYAIDYFTRSLALETEGTNVIIGGLSPGMVVTDMLVGPVSTDTPINREAVKIFHILADQVEPVCRYLVDRILKNRKNGVVIKWLTGRKIMMRFMKNMVRKRRVEGLPDL
jgi:NAD(P)-dependent dehydrogenase (short-subunit alcohol dehydrogenase family)